MGYGVLDKVVYPVGYYMMNNYLSELGEVIIRSLI